MTPERWKQVDELLDAALERTPSARPRFLDEACGADAELRAEVASLLAAHEQAKDFIEAPAFEVAARRVADDATGASVADAPEFASGTRIGRYEILSLLGMGGMGEVYLAHDARLNRNVALKLLPAAFTQEQERVDRFAREARLISALNHPNIITIYDIGHDAERHHHYIATEFIDGLTLRELIRTARLATNKTLRIARQICEALAAAHGAGVVHRDIKPENIMVRPDGYVKVLDFGLAKLIQPGASHDSQPLSVFDTQAHTRAGSVMGTVKYMSPEQALGDAVDHRTDVFSFGVVLYEMLAGTPPFAGKTAAATFDLILHHTPAPLANSDSHAHEELERIVNRALEKDSDVRYQTMADMCAELKRLQRGIDSGEFEKFDKKLHSQSLAANTSGASGIPNFSQPQSEIHTGSNKPNTTNDSVSPASRTREQNLWRDLRANGFGNLSTHGKLVALGAIVAFVLLPLWWVYHAGFGQTGEPASSGSNAESNAVASWSNATVSRFTDKPGAELFPNFAPDGKSIVYAGDASGNRDIYLQRVGGANPRNLTPDSPLEDTQPAFSPDGERIIFRSSRDGGGIFLMGATGESVKRVTDFGFNPVWSPDGQHILVATDNVQSPDNRGVIPSQLWRVEVDTGNRQLITEGDAVQPSWSPHNHRIAYWSLSRGGGQRDIWTIGVSGAAAIKVTDDAAVDWNPVWSPDGKHLYFISDRSGSMNLWRVSLDEETGQVRGAPEPVTTPSSYSQHISLSADNRRMAYTQVASEANIRQAAFNSVTARIEGQPLQITSGAKHVVSPSLSPDGKWFAYSSQGEKQEDIFIVNRDGTGARHVTNDTHKDRNPRISPDGERIAFYSDRSGKYESWVINRDGSELRQLTSIEGASVVYPSWSPDGGRIIYNVRGTSPSIVEIDSVQEAQAGGQRGLRVIQTLPEVQAPHRFWAWSWSPDGKRIAGWWGGVHPTSLMLYSFATNDYERFDEPGNNPIWFKDNRQLLYTTRGELHTFDTATRKSRPLLSVAPHTLQGYGLSSDNRTLYYSLVTIEADIWLITLNPPK